MKCLLCDAEAWSSTPFCPKHDTAFREPCTLLKVCLECKTFGALVDDRDRWYGMDVNTISTDHIVAEILLNTPEAIGPSEEGVI